MIYTVNTKLYEAIENDLETWYKSFQCPWSRMYKDGELYGYKGVLDNLELKVMAISSSVLVVSLEGIHNKDYNPFKNYYTMTEENGYWFCEDACEDNNE